MYGEMDLDGIHKRVKEIVLQQFERKKKGSESLQDRYREFLLNTIDMKKREVDLSNRKKKIASEKAVDEAVIVVIRERNDV